MQRLLVVATACVACGSHDPAPPAPAPPPVLAPSDAKPATSPTLPVPGVHLPGGATPLAYDLRLEVDPDRDTFSGTVAIRVRLDRASDHVWLHADELAISEAHWEGGKLEVVPAAEGMLAVKLGKQVPPGEVTLSFAFTGTTQHDEEGLFRQQDRNRWYLYSQGESEFARRITPCFDEPAWKTPWRVTVVAPKQNVIAGNMPIAHDHVLADGRREVSFVETPAMPSYLLALAVGPFAIVDAGTVGKAHVPVRVLTFPRRAKAVGSVARQTGRLVALLEDYTAIPLPLAKLDIVTVPHLFGAMENPGLITFDADIVFAGDRRYAVIAAHELAHQWFGNYVTPIWWDDLWLSEAFASWLGERVAAQNEGHPPSELHLAFTRESALAADGEAGAKPLHRAIAFDPDNAFDSIAYDKGEAVLTMFEAWAGPDLFRAALRAYLAAHALGSVTTADLVSALATATTPETAQALQGYVDHAGAPVVELALTCAAGKPVLTARARDHLTVPVCVRVPGNARACALAGAATQLPIGDTCPAWVVATDGGYYHVVWTDHGPRGPL
ncbi:MAG: M1 family metallopeptidase, partial [Kofleriaceae bacterium]